jgi:hypothetical protein
MLGYCLPVPPERKRDGTAALADEERLHEIVGSPDTEVLVSAASTALALTMINPLLAGTTDEERLWFASEVVTHDGFQELVDQVAGGLESFPKSYLDGESCPGIYLKVSAIVTDIIGAAGGEEADAAGGGPYVADAEGDLIILGNSGFVNYGVQVSDAVADTVKEVLLLRGRDVTSLVEPGPKVDQTYCLGSGCFDVVFLKGFSELDCAGQLDPGHPGGLATRANTARAIWNAVTIFAALPEPEVPLSVVIGDGECGEGLSAVIERGDSAGVVPEAMECCGRFPHQVAGWLFGELVDPSDFAGFVCSVRHVLSNALDCFTERGLHRRDLFSCDLVGAAAYQSECVCQDDGKITPCPVKPILSDGIVSPPTGGPGTEFAFSVHYYDGLADPPAYVQVIIDGDSLDMFLSSGGITDGTYSYVTRLSPGMHTYFFSCADTSGSVARLPSIGLDPFEGPFVATAPVLKKGCVDPPGAIRRPSSGTGWITMTMTGSGPCGYVFSSTGILLK